MQNILGIIILLFLAWLFSEKKKDFPWRFASLALLLHFLLAIILLKIPFVRDILALGGRGVDLIASASREATVFVFGYVGGGDTPFEVVNEHAQLILAFQVLPQIIFLSVIIAVLWHWKVLPKIIEGFAWLLERSIKISGALGVGASSSIFLGMIEAPMVIRAHLNQMSRPELFTLMTCGMATVSGTVMLLYSSFLRDRIADSFGHILTASVIAVPAALLIARIVMPSQNSATPQKLTHQLSYESTLDAVTKGTQSGLQVTVGVIAMLLVFVALVALLNNFLGLLPALNGDPLTIERFLGWLFTPIAWCMGLTFEEAGIGGRLLGTKIVLTEFTAFVDLINLPESALSERSYLIMVYGLTGFANLASVGIMIGGLTILAEERRQEIIRQAPKAMLTGALASCLSATVVGLLI